MIQAKNISVSLSGRKVVSDVSFQAMPGRLTAIIGPNGSGKTTTMKALSGERTFEGAILFNGRDLRTMNPRELAQSRAVLAQSISLGFPFLVREVLEALAERFEVTEEVADHAPERMTFKLPRELVA